jgi:hypothetical protein
MPHYAHENINGVHRDGKFIQPTASSSSPVGAFTLSFTIPFKFVDSLRLVNYRLFTLPSFEKRNERNILYTADAFEQWASNSTFLDVLKDSQVSIIVK